MRLLIALVALALAAGTVTAQSSWVGGSCPVATAPTAPVRGTAVPPCCVKVVVSYPDNVIGAGSGTVLLFDGRTDCVLTCKHVVEGALSVKVVAGGKTYPATVRAVDDKDDLALVRIGAALPHAYLADAEARHGEPLATWGFGGGSFRPVGGTATGSSSAEAPNVPGDSGAGVFNKAGKLVGVHCAGDSRTLAIRVTLASVKRFLASVVCKCKACDCSPCECTETAPMPRKKVNHQFPPGGVSREEMTPAGKDKFCVNGRPCPDFETFRAAVLGADDRLVDDSAWPYVYVIGAEADRERVFKDFAENPELLQTNVRLKGYPRDHPMVADYGPGLIHVQAANGRPLLALDKYEGAGKLSSQIKTALAAYDPAKDPGPGKPYPKDEPKTPDQPPVVPAKPLPAWVYVVIAVAALFVLTRKRS